MEGITNFDDVPRGSWKSRNCLSFGEYTRSWSFNGTWRTIMRRFCMWAIIILRTVMNILTIAFHTLGSKIVSMVLGVILGILSFIFVFWCLTMIDRAHGRRACWFCGLLVVGLLSDDQHNGDRRANSTPPLGTDPSRCLRWCHCPSSCRPFGIVLGNSTYRFQHHLVLPLDIDWGVWIPLYQATCSCLGLLGRNKTLRRGPRWKLVRWIQSMNVIRTQADGT